MINGTRSMDGNPESNIVGGYPIIGVPTNNNVLYFENGAWYYVTISGTGSIIGIANVGVGQGILRNIAGGTAYLYSLATTANLNLALSGNTIVFDVAPVQNNINTINSSAGALTLAGGLVAPSLNTIVPMKYVGQDTGGNIGVFVAPNYVSSIGLSMPSIFAVANSPITDSGTISVTFNNEAANLIFASPDGSGGQPTFRSLVAGDIPTLPYLTSFNTRTSPAIMPATGDYSLNQITGFNVALPISGQVLQYDGSNFTNQPANIYGNTYFYNGATISAALNTVYVVSNTTVNLPYPTSSDIGKRILISTAVGGYAYISLPFSCSLGYYGEGFTFHANHGVVELIVSESGEYELLSCTGLWTTDALPYLITGSNLALENLTDASISGVSNGQVLAWNGSAWTNVNPSAGGITSITSAGPGESLIYSSTSSTVALKSLNGANSIYFTDSGGQITFSLSPNLSDVESIASATNSLAMEPSTVTWPNLVFQNTSLLSCLAIDSTNKMWYSTLYNQIANIGVGHGVFYGTSGNTAQFKNLNFSNDYVITDTSGTIGISLNSLLHNIQGINSGSGATTFQNTIQLGNPALNNSATKFLTMDSSNNVTYSIPSFTGQNIYNADGTLTAATRTINPYASANSTIVFNNINLQFTNNTNLVPGNPTDPLNFVLYFNSSGVSRGKYEATTCYSAFVNIGALGATGNFKNFYSVDSHLSAQTCWTLKVYIYENYNSVAVNVFTSVYTINMNSSTNQTTNPQTVYPEWSTTNNSGYVLELSTANQYILNLRVRNVSSGSLTNALSAKIEHYGDTTGQVVSTTVSAGNLAYNTVVPTLAYTLPINWQLNSGNNSTNSLPGIIWSYTYWPRLVKINYYICGVSTNAGQNILITFSNNSVILGSNTARTTTNNAITAIQGFWILDPYPSQISGGLINGVNTLSVTSSSFTNINYQYMQWTINFEFLQK